MFFDVKKKQANAVLDSFNKYNKERDEKPDWKEAGLSKMADGGVAGEAEQQEDPDHMQALEAHSEEMHSAMEAKDFPRHARAMKAFLNEHELHEKKKGIDYGNPSDEKDAPNKIAGDEYK